MHTFATDGVVFSYNADLSGDVSVLLVGDDGMATDGPYEIPGQALLEFAAEYVRKRRISILESMDAEEVLLACLVERRKPNAKSH